MSAPLPPRLESEPGERRRPHLTILSETKALVRVLDDHRISRELDIGAHDGAYELKLREGEYLGWFALIEPVSDLHPALHALTGDDERWRVAPPCLSTRPKPTSSRPRTKTTAAFCRCSFG